MTSPLGGIEPHQDTITVVDPNGVELKRTRPFNIPDNVGRLLEPYCYVGFRCPRFRSSPLK